MSSRVVLALLLLRGILIPFFLLVTIIALLVKILLESFLLLFFISFLGTFSNEVSSLATVEAGSLGHIRFLPV